MNPAKNPASSGPSDTDLPSPTRTPKPATMTGAKLPLLTCGTWDAVLAGQHPEVQPGRGRDRDRDRPGPDDHVDLERAGEVEVAGEAEVDEEVAVGVDVQVDDRQGDVRLAGLDLAQRVGQLELDVEHAEAVADLAVEDLELQPGQLAGPLAVQRQPEPVQHRVVEHRGQGDGLQRGELRAEQPAGRGVELQRGQVGERVLARVDGLVGALQRLDHVLEDFQAGRVAQRDVLAYAQVLQVEVLRPLARHRRGRLAEHVPGQPWFLGEVGTEERAEQGQVHRLVPGPGGRRVPHLDPVQAGQREVEVQVVVAEPDPEVRDVHLEGEVAQVDRVEQVPRRGQLEVQAGFGLADQVFQYLAEGQVTEPGGQDGVDPGAERGAGVHAQAEDLQGSEQLDLGPGPGRDREVGVGGRLGHGCCGGAAVLTLVTLKPSATRVTPNSEGDGLLVLKSSASPMP